MKRLGAILTVSLAYSLFTSPALAAQSACPGQGLGFLCFTAGDLGRVVGSFITLLFVLIGLVALGFLVWGGIKWLTSEGDKNAVEAARNHIINAIIGLIVIFLSYLIVNLVLQFVTGGVVSLNNFSIPTLGQPNM